MRTLVGELLMRTRVGADLVGANLVGVDLVGEDTNKGGNLNLNLFHITPVKRSR